MKIVLEVFNMRIMGDKLCYQRRQVDLSRKGMDPDVIAQSLIQHQLHTSNGGVLQECVVHSTSWRYAVPGKIILTYVCYSDKMEFGRGILNTITIKQLQKIHITSGRPRSRAGRERQVVAHAMRHISFLIKTDHENEFKDAFTPQTRRIFKSLWVSLAGRLTL